MGRDILRPEKRLWIGLGNSRLVRSRTGLIGSSKRVEAPCIDYHLQVTFNAKIEPILVGKLPNSSIHKSADHAIMSRVMECK